MMEHFVAICEVLKDFKGAMIAAPEDSFDFSADEMTAVSRRVDNYFWNRLSTASLATFVHLFDARIALWERFSAAERVSDRNYRVLFNYSFDQISTEQIMTDCVRSGNWDKLRDVMTLGYPEENSETGWRAMSHFVSAVITNPSLTASWFRNETPTVIVRKIQDAGFSAMPYLTASGMPLAEQRAWCRQNPFQAMRWIGGVDETTDDELLVMGLEIIEKCRAIMLFARVVLLSDGYFRVNEVNDIARFWRIALTLPFDLQAVLCLRAYGLAGMVITVPEEVWRDLLAKRE